MIKKAFCLIMIVALIMGLYGCASSKASEYARDRGQIAVEITEDYITGNITADVARSKLSVQESMLEQYLEKQDKDTVEYQKDTLVKTYISSCSTAILLNVSGNQSKSHIEETVKKLQKAIKQ